MRICALFSCFKNKCLYEIFLWIDGEGVSLCYTLVLFEEISGWSLTLLRQSDCQFIANGAGSDGWCEINPKQTDRLFSGLGDVFGVIILGVLANRSGLCGWKANEYGAGHAQWSLCQLQVLLSSWVWANSLVTRFLTSWCFCAYAASANPPENGRHCSLLPWWCRPVFSDFSDQPISLAWISRFSAFLGCRGHLCGG